MFVSLLDCALEHHENNWIREEEDREEDRKSSLLGLTKCALHARSHKARNRCAPDKYRAKSVQPLYQLASIVTIAQTTDGSTAKTSEYGAVSRPVWL